MLWVQTRLLLVLFSIYNAVIIGPLKSIITSYTIIVYTITIITVVRVLCVISVGEFAFCDDTLW